MRITIAEAERIGGGPLSWLLPVNPDTGQPGRIKLVADSGGAFKGAAFAAFIASRPELLYIRTRAKSPGQNGVRERGFGSLKYEHLYRVHEQIATAEVLYREAEAYRRIFNHVRLHEVLGFRQPIDVLHDPLLHPIRNKPKTLCHILDAGHGRPFPATHHLAIPHFNSWLGLTRPPASPSDCCRWSLE